MYNSASKHIVIVAAYTGTMSNINPLGPPEVPHTRPQPRPEAASQYEPSAEPDSLNEHVEEPGDPDGLVAAEEHQRWLDNSPAPSAALEPQKKRRWPVVLLVAGLLLASAAGAYWFGSRKAAAPAARQTSNTSKAPAASAKTNPPVATKHYDSVTYTLGLDYPAEWLVSDTTAKLALSSPGVDLVDSGGAKVRGRAVLSVQNKLASIPNYPKAPALATLVSDKLTYKQPTAVQRAQTYLSFLTFTGTSGLDRLYVTGDTGYQQGQQIPETDIARGNPLVGISFELCGSNDCTASSQPAISVQAASWKASPLSKQLVEIIQSITLN